MKGGGNPFSDSFHQPPPPPPPTQISRGLCFYPTNMTTRLVPWLKRIYNLEQAIKLTQLILMYDRPLQWKRWDTAKCSGRSQMTSPAKDTYTLSLVTNEIKAIWGGILEITGNFVKWRQRDGHWRWETTGKAETGWSVQPTDTGDVRMGPDQEQAYT